LVLDHFNALLHRAACLTTVADNNLDRLLQSLFSQAFD
jgi:hypothetical protein